MTEVEWPSWSATTRQRAYLSGLIVKHEVPAPTVEAMEVLVTREDFTKKDASDLIGQFLLLPIRATATKSSGVSTAGLLKTAGAGYTPKRISPLDDLPDTRFAIPVSELSPTVAALAGGSDLLFGEMKTYKGWRYMNILHGSHPRFSRTKIKGAGSQEIADILRKDVVHYAKVYGTHYTCCSICGAELTDDQSRDRVMGPVCYGNMAPWMKK